MSTAAPQPLTKTKLLDTAMHIIRAKGYTATTVDDICVAAGLTKGSFFHYFKSKEQLAVEAAQHFADMAAGLFSTAPYQQIADPLDRLLGYIDFRTAILQGELADFTCLLGTMVQEAYDTHPQIRAACDQHISEHAMTIQQIIEQAKAKYAPDAEWTAESLAFYTQAVLQGGYILAKAKQSPAITVECLGHLRRYVESLFPNHRTTSST